MVEQKQWRMSSGMVSGVLAGLLGLSLGVYGPWSSADGLKISSLKASLQNAASLDTKYPIAELFGFSVAFQGLTPPGQKPQPPGQLTDNPNEAVGPSCYDPETNELTIRFEGGLDGFGQPKPDLLVVIHAADLVQKKKSGLWETPTSDPLASPVTVQKIQPATGIVEKVNPELTSLTVKVQTMGAADRYGLQLEWVRGVVAPMFNPALTAERVQLEVTGRVSLPGELSGEALPVNVDSVYAGQ
jgi:hypothetical protein